MVNTMEWLTARDISYLRQLGQYYQCECNVHSKLDLMKHLCVNLRNLSIFVQQVEQLTAAQKRYLVQLLFDERVAYSPDDARLRARFATYDEPQPQAVHELLQSFERRGWLFMSTSGETRGMLQMAADLRERYRAGFVRYLQSAQPLRVPPTHYREEKYWLLTDLRLFLRFVGERGLALTQHGVIPKKWLQQFMQQCSVSESLQLQGWRFGYGRSYREYPQRFSLLYDFAYAQQWLIEREQRLYVSELGLLMSEQLTEQHSEWLVRYWLKSYRRAIPNVTALVRLLCAICTEWVDGDWLIEQLQGFVKPFYYDNPQDVLRQRVIPMLVSLGLLRIADDGPQWFVQTTEPSSETFGAPWQMERHADQPLNA